VRQNIHKRMLAYDGMPVYPDIGFYEDLGNREWKQYALPDDNEPESGARANHLFHSSTGSRHRRCWTNR
jgi:FPC/CPF motif-containing protein YcgG